MSNFRAVIGRGQHQHKSMETYYLFTAEDARSTCEGGRAGISLFRTPSLDSRSAFAGNCAPRSEPAASEPSETEALPPAAAGSLQTSAHWPAPLKEAERA